MSTLLRFAGIAIALSSLLSSTGCVCARAPYHGRIPSRNLARAREPVGTAASAMTGATAPGSTPAQPEYVVAR